MKLIIDTNIYLNFYRMSEQPLTYFDSLIKLINEEKIELILPKQIEDEFDRNKLGTGADFVKSLSESSEFKEPVFLRSYKEIKKLKVLMHKIKALKKKIILEHSKRMKDQSSLINRKIKQLFALAHKPAEEENILLKAHFRTLRGNPPRKGNDSFGDAIIWETVLTMLDDDIVIVSADGDFSDDDKKELTAFLLKEWKTRSNKSIKLYTNLGLFINDISGKKNPISKKVIKQEDYLSNFSRLSRYSPLQYMDSVKTVDYVSNPSVVTSNIFENRVSGIGLMGSRYCSCCGVSIGGWGELSIWNNFENNCERCKNNPGVPTSCISCGVHYHLSFLTGSSACPNCGHKKFDL